MQPRMKTMTLEEIKKTEKNWLTPSDIAPFIGSHPQTIINSARQHPELVGYPFTFCGTNMKISPVGFINWYEGRR